jgi:hypothetical protein
MIAVRPEPSKLKPQIRSASSRSAAEKAFGAACLGIIIRSFHPLITLPLEFPLILFGSENIAMRRGVSVQLRNSRTLAAFRWHG